MRGAVEGVDIIVLLNSRRKAIRVSLDSVGVAASTLCLAGLLAVMFYGGIRYADSHTGALVGTFRAQTAAMWRHELNKQEEMLRSVRVDAEKSLDAMATRLSLLQGHVMRLDALGARLATMADLKDMEFGFDSPPGIGGPAPEYVQESIDVSDLLNTLAQLEAGLQDKAEKLAAMESMLIDRTLQEQTVPDGSPAAGAWVSSLFGFRSDPVTGKREFHQGIDLAGRPEMPIAAVAAGIVTWSGIRYGYGNMVEISHGNGYLTRYAHNRKNLVSVGERVEKGEIIALMGSSGRSTGTHVHFEVVRYGTHVDPRRHIALQ
jgi:murein DD-endopeptidase MepM/ murein hydrolase activator NlpD